VKELDTDPKERLFFDIERTLWPFPSEEKDARKGFAVGGREVEALRQVHDILVKGKEPEESFLASSEISVVFFSYQGRRFVHLNRVDRRGREIDIGYRFVPHETEDMTVHFALIPLGKLSAGEYQVNVVQSPMARKYRRHHEPTSGALARRIVCNSFSFSISEQGE
jgi:hypothetical protein